MRKKLNKIIRKSCIVKNRDLMIMKKDVICCKDCKYYAIAELNSDGTENKRYKPSVCIAEYYAKPREPDWFCADAEPKCDTMQE